MSNVQKLPLPYTVVLMRSFRFSDIPEWEAEPETDSYVAHVKATGHEEAVKAAKQQVLEADQKELGKDFMRRMQLDTDEYTFIALFDGHIEAKYHGWQHNGGQG